MSRKTMCSRRTVSAATAVAALLAGWGAAGPALAHGAPTDPVSRAHACSPEGGTAARSAACRAAVAANGGGSFAAWDNLRVAGVNGRDRERIPDGKLCSGGLPAYRGLDVARADWPATRLAAGAALTVRYASTIPHSGTFRLYLTKPGYDPSKPLTWSDLPERPFAVVEDPPLTGGAYRLPVKLPADRTGRHVLYTIWQNSSTPDTYYSCSDVLLTGGAGGGASRRVPAGTTPSPARSTSPAARDRVTPAPGASSADAGGTSGPRSGTPTAEAAKDPAGAAPSPGGAARTAAAPEAASSGPGAPLVAGGAAAVLLLTGGTALAVRLRRR
ncbi:MULTISPECIES: lytic polysaccharide monooxygenase [unclassified Streptomyces]|uniref:lytic polysaccharide monooxygenase n=1 Tax=unclassified Streptomyces TaxID=2593676 RepID=UPI0033AD76E9